MVRIATRRALTSLDVNAASTILLLTQRRLSSALALASHGASPMFHASPHTPPSTAASIVTSSSSDTSRGK